jgi:hypothetical protein
MKSPEFTEMALRQRKLVSRVRLGLKPLEHEGPLELGEPVYTSAGVVYPSRETALVLRPAVEVGARVEASPWDSGAFYKSLCANVSKEPEAQRAVFAASTLPAPEYREYLVQYIATCYDCAEDYVQGRPNRFSDPLGILDSRRWDSRVFEVRFQRTIPVNELTLMAIFVPNWIKGEKKYESMLGYLGVLRGARVEVVYYRGEREQLQPKLREWLVKNICSG